MPQTPLRLSPLHDALDHLRPTWGTVDEMPVALHFGDAAAERAAAARLGLCDASALARATLKGPAAADLLRSHAAPVPAHIYEVAALAGDGFVARTGSTEFFVEDGPGGGLARQLAAAAATAEVDAYDVLRQDAALLLSGEQAVNVLRETCGYEFHAPSTDGAAANGQQRSWLGPARPSSSPSVVFTRVAGVSAMLLPRQLNGVALIGLWFDGTYGLYLWETLLEIVREQGGEPIGLATFFPSLGQST